MHTHDLAYAILEHMKRARSKGFTIVEVLIVLAVTGGLFVSAALLISGRQNQTQFDQSIRQAEAQIQQTINEVSTGFYPSTNNFRCTAPVGATQPTISTLAPNQQGTNSGCLFLGKAMQFKVQGTDPEQAAIFTIVGLQKKPSSTLEVTGLKEAGAMPIGNTVPGAIDTKRLQYGLTTAWARYNGTPIGAVAFVSSLAHYGADGIISGSQQAQMVPIPNLALNQTVTTAATTIRTELRKIDAPTDLPYGVQICYASGGTNQSGLITIGSNGRQLNVTLQIKGNKTCA